jgi:hypothetical protein
VLNGIDEPFMDLLGEAFGFDQKDLLQELCYKAMSPRQLLASPSNSLDAFPFVSNLKDRTTTLSFMSPSNSNNPTTTPHLVSPSSFDLTKSIGISTISQNHLMAPKLPGNFESSLEKL